MKSKYTAVTLADIADIAGISASAVSAILGNRYIERRISARTAERVKKIARSLDYFPNMASRRLRSHRKATRLYDIAIFTSYEAPLSLASGLLGVLQETTNRYASEHTRYAFAIEMFHAGRLKDKLGLLDAYRYHGVLIANTLLEDDAFLSTTRLPYVSVVLGRRIPGHHCVLEEPGLVGKRSAETLIQNERKNLAVVFGSPLTQSTADRVDSFIQTAQMHALNRPKMIRCDGLHAQHAIFAVRKFLASGERCDGVFVVTDSLSIGAYHVFQESGFRIPDDILMVGVGDFEMADFFMPQLATMVCTNNTMTEKAIPLLFDLLDGKQNQPHEIHVVPPGFLRTSDQRHPSLGLRDY